MYKKKLLFKNTNETFNQEATAIESVWAFLYGVEKKTTGRFRIRITKMSAQDLIQMGLAPEETPPEFYGLQATLDRWNESVGWVALFDWVGDPMASIDDIEKDLGTQFQAFVTGIPVEEQFTFENPKPPKPPKDRTSKKPKKRFKKPSGKLDKYVTDVKKDKVNKYDPGDFDWI